MALSLSAWDELVQDALSARTVVLEGRKKVGRRGGEVPSESAEDTGESNSDSSEEQPKRSSYMKDSSRKRLHFGLPENTAGESEVEEVSEAEGRKQLDSGDERDRDGEALVPRGVDALEAVRFFF